MEYLTLRDIPHRHFPPLNRTSMTSPDSSRDLERAGGLPSLAAVCSLLLPAPSRSANPTLTSSLSLSSLPPHPRPLLSPPPTSLPVVSSITAVASGSSSDPDSVPDHSCAVKPAAVPEPAQKPAPESASSTQARYVYKSPAGTTQLSLPRLDSLVPARRTSMEEINEPSQNHHMLRHSPPFQPGEQRPSQNSLPSFSQVCWLCIVDLPT